MKTKILFHVKVADPARTFYDMASGLYVSQDKVEPVYLETPAVRQALQRGGLIKVQPVIEEDEPALPPPATAPEVPTVPETSETSTQESPEEGADESSEGEEAPAITEDEQPAGNDEGDEEPQTTEEEDTEEQELSLKDLVKGKLSGKKNKK